MTKGPMIPPSSPDWLQARTWIEAKIAGYMEELTSLTIRVQEADQLRGKIAAFREILSAAAPPDKPDTVIVEGGPY